MSDTSGEAFTIKKLIRTIFRWIGMLVVGVASLIALGMVEIPREHELEIARNIEAGGGNVRFGYCGPEWIPEGIRGFISVFDRVVRVDFFSLEGHLLPIEDNVVQEVLNLRYVYMIDFAETPVRNADLEQCQQMINIEDVGLSNTQIGDSGLKHLSRIPRLTRICLDGTRVTDNGVASLIRLPNLKSLILNRTEVTDEGMKDIGRLTSLRELYLDNTSITDQGLAELHTLSNLAQLHLSETQTTPEGRENFRKALPKCRIYPLQ